jgi:cGMP-dependent protein kinase
MQQQQQKMAGSPLPQGAKQQPAAHAASPNNKPILAASSGLQRIRRAELQTLGRLGVGAFGLVTLEINTRTGETYALKAVSKGYLQKLRMEYSAVNERRILKMVSSPFVIRLLTTYNGREYVYFLLEAALGGELFTTYEKHRLYGCEEHARFYLACVVEAFAHLHEKNILYRDLKPENLLLDRAGYCKVTDFGLARVTRDKTYSVVGTP